VREELEIWVKMQEAYQKISQVKDLVTVIEILSENQLEHKDRKIYKDRYTVFEVTEIVYNALLAGQDSQEVREMLQTLYTTKDINPPYFFSFSFSVGVYLPLFSPLVFPPIITLFHYLKLRKFGKPAKVKTD